MPVTSFHKPTGEWLTSFGKDAKPGDAHTISISSTSKSQRYASGNPKSCQFTTYTLAEPVAVDEYGEPLFRLADCNPICPLDVAA
jgi:hypothetical protein